MLLVLAAALTIDGNCLPKHSHYLFQLTQNVNIWYQRDGSITQTNTVLVIGRQRLKEMRHRLLVVNSAYCFRQHAADVDRLNLVALHLLHLVWHRVCYHHLPAEHQNCMFNRTGLVGGLMSISAQRGYIVSAKIILHLKGDISEIVQKNITFCRTYKKLCETRVREVSISVTIWDLLTAPICT